MEVSTFKEIVNRTFIDGMLIGALIVCAIWIAAKGLNDKGGKRVLIATKKKSIDWTTWDDGPLPGIQKSQKRA